ncbi:putative extracellular serine/threonine protein kinase FAM20C [Apostichopus japonicus]|uniref:Putative extracellular serine/threonine protein kinase FAM20C n=1 Tax=Stichopus japonicus TaxID=307972 RepID=A0A2G8L467_STIJA|nr:putative extracellular serine/threonine protein kinase FAM20C [Apostichopus japonicus]
MMKLRQRWVFGVVLLVPFLWITVVFWATQHGRNVRISQGGGDNLVLPKRSGNTSVDSSSQSEDHEDTSDEEREVMRKKGLPYDSTLFFASRKRSRIPYKKVENRNKFEALFRDFPSYNSVPKLKSSDYLIRDREPEKHRKVWQRFHRAINRYEMYSYNNTELFNNYLNYLGTTPILRARAKSGGTQVKLFLVFADGGEALVKPWRVPRDYETVPDHYYFADIERHNAEISAFHLDRILDFRRVPPNAGRIFNLSRDIYDRADSSLSREFYRSPANNLCFMTDCDQHCDIAETPVCGNPDQIEGSVAAFLPPETSAKRSSWTHPFKRSYSKRTRTEWEKDPSYCKRVVMKQHPFNSGRRLLDLIDLAIFDFFAGNLDRHSYNTFQLFGNFSAILHLDHGRGFGKYKTDCMSCLVPLTQCCIIRKSTYERLLILQKNEYKLGDVMRESLSTDLIAPVLYEPHYDALNRRLDIIIKHVNKCLNTADSPEDVLKAEPRIEDYHESDFLKSTSKDEEFDF